MIINIRVAFVQYACTCTCIQCVHTCIFILCDVVHTNGFYSSRCQKLLNGK